MQECKVVVSYTEQRLVDAAQALAEKTQLDLISPTDIQQFDGYVLLLTPERLQIQKSGKDALGPVYVDFNAGKLAHRRQFRGKEVLAKAVGIQKIPDIKIIDATAGLAEDAFVMAMLGAQVTLLERSKILAALVEDALLRGSESDLNEICQRMNLINADAVEYLQQLDESQKPDVIYLDPMFPHRKKSALVKKEMRVVRDLVGDDIDSVELFEIAMHKAKRRVVVKRPQSADVLANKQPTFVISSKSHRFDVYSTFKSVTII